MASLHQATTPSRMPHRRSVDGNIKDLLDCRSVAGVSSNDCRVTRALQMHSSMVQRLALHTVMEGHQGCVNALAWSSEGSLLLSGSDDTRVNIWDYASKKLVQSIDSGHSANIFCVKFLPETCNDVLVSGAGDSEVRVHRVSNHSGGNSSPHFQCHTRRVKKLAVEDGNPHVIWSASEDGTLRQHDLRESISCSHNGSGTSEHECRNVLLDLRSGAKRSLSDPPRHSLALKTCAINRTRPHELLVGGSDAFARLYDRRMLPPLSSSRTQRKLPPCVFYLSPAHLSEFSRTGLHLTHVTFSPNGTEVLLSYSGEHVYLMDVDSRKDDSIVYVASDLPKRIVLGPINGVQITPAKISTSRQKSPQFYEYQELLDEAMEALKENGKFHDAIEVASEVLETRGFDVDTSVQVSFLCIRAEAFLKRLWKHDVHMAIRDCNKARALDPTSAEAHGIMAEALSRLAKHKEALDYALRAQHLDSSNKKLSEIVTSLKAKLVAAEEAKLTGNEDKGSSQGHGPYGIHSLSQLITCSEGDQSDFSLESRRSEREDSDLDDDMEMEMEIEMLVGDEDENTGEPGSRQGSSLNLRLKRKVNSSREKNTKIQFSVDDSESSQPEPVLDMRQRYVGHCNVGTDIKQANFLGEKGDYVASGSDDGRWFIWHKRTGKLMKLLKGDENVVNCVQCHPFDAAVATSGIDNTIKVWTPCAQEPSLVTGGVAGPESGDFLQIMCENQQKMRRPREIGFPFEILQRFRVPERGMRPPLECIQS